MSAPMAVDGGPATAGRANRADALGFPWSSALLWLVPLPAMGRRRTRGVSGAQGSWFSIVAKPAYDDEMWILYPADRL